MKKRHTPSFTRRRLAAVTRKAISSYYTEDEQEQIVRAAKKQGISISAFVAAAAVKEARRSNREDFPKP